MKQSMTGFYTKLNPNMAWKEGGEVLDILVFSLLPQINITSCQKLLLNTKHADSVNGNH